jgi:hypothetical protein
MRSSRSFEVFSTPGWISTKPEHCPLKKKESQNGNTTREDGGNSTLHPAELEIIKHRAEDGLSCVDQKTQELQD